MLQIDEDDEDDEDDDDDDNDVDEQGEDYCLKWQRQAEGRLKLS